MNSFQLVHKGLNHFDRLCIDTDDIHIAIEIRVMNWLGSRYALLDKKESGVAFEP